MGMTISEAIETLSYTNSYGNVNVAKSVAINIMRKYQKIEQLINNAKDSDGAVKYNWLYEQIREVTNE